MLYACLDAHDLFFGLLDEGELVGQGIEAGLGGQLVRFIAQAGAGGDQDGIDAVVLGALQTQLGIELHLQGDDA
jgi:hypothetical protein